METQIMKKNSQLNCAIYCRLSREDENTVQSSSINSQKDILTEYVKSNNWNIYDYYIDDGYTGTNFNRPAFQRMIQDIENGKINIVITKDLSRLGRNYIDTGKYTEFYFPDHNVRYIALNDNYDSNIEDEIAPFKNIINEWYARDISKKVKSVVKLKHSQGKLFSTSLSLYGYSYDKEGRRQIDPVTAPVVKKIFEMYVEGYSLREIANTLKNEKVVYPKYYYYLKKGVYKEDFINKPVEEMYNWKTEMISRVLQRGMDYCGNLVLGRTEKKNFKIKKRTYHKLDDRIIHKDCVEPIISKELYELASRRAKTFKKSHKLFEEDIFNGLIICKCCGKPLRFRYLTRGSKTRGYYFCRYKKCVNKASVYLDEIKEIIDKNIKSIMTIIRNNSDMVEKKLKEIMQNFYAREIEQIHEINQKISELENEKERNKNLLEHVYESKINGIISDSIYSKLLTKYNEAYTVADSSIKKLKKELNQISDTESKEKELKKFFEYIKVYADSENYSYDKLVESVVIGRLPGRSKYNVEINLFGLDSEMMEVIKNEL